MYAQKIALLLALIASPAFAQEAEVFSSKIKVTCYNYELGLEFRMRPRAPRIGEKVQIFTQSEQTFVRAKVDVTVFNLKANRKVITKLVADDQTDPWESSWPVYNAQGFKFYTSDQSEPNTLFYDGKEISESSTCVFK